MAKPHSAGDPEISNCEVWDEVCVLPVFWWIARLAFGGQEATRPADVEINFGAEECRIVAFWVDGRVVHFDDLLLRQRLLEESFAVLLEIGDRPLVEAREPLHNFRVAPKL